MKTGLKKTLIQGFVLIILLFLFGCDFRHTLLEAFLTNGDETKLISFDRNIDLGWSVAIREDVALVAADNSAYIYRRHGDLWKKEANMIPNRKPDDLWYHDYDEYACWSVALGKNIAVISSLPVYYDFYYNEYYMFHGTGIVYVYRFKGKSWQLETTLTASFNPNSNAFGFAVSASGDVIAVGDPQSGVVYLFGHYGNTWIEEAKIIPGDGVANAGFGSAVVVSGNVLIIGDPMKDHSAENAGMVFIYRFNGASWDEEARLTASDAASDDRFGAAVSVNEDVAVIGAPGVVESWESSGSAYIFRYDGSSWRQEKKLISDASGAFGTAVATNGKQIIIGVPYHYDTGLAIVYGWSGSTWYQENQLSPSDYRSERRFGFSVAIDDYHALIGAPYYLTYYYEYYPYYREVRNDGAAYVYSIN